MAELGARSHPESPRRTSSLETFQDRVRREGMDLERETIEVVQVNVGKYCNQACHHCHVDAGPNRTEKMDGRVAGRILKLLERSPTVRVLDITGGAPELNPLIEGESASLDLIVVRGPIDVVRRFPLDMIGISVLEEDEDSSECIQLLPPAGNSRSPGNPIDCEEHISMVSGNERRLHFDDPVFEPLYVVHE